MLLPKSIFVQDGGIQYSTAIVFNSRNYCITYTDNVLAYLKAHEWTLLKFWGGLNFPHDLIFCTKKTRHRPPTTSI